MFKSIKLCTGISDCHNFISSFTNSNIAKDEMSIFRYRVLEISIMSFYLQIYRALISLLFRILLGEDAAYEML